jgi:hypothetical protein
MHSEELVKNTQKIIGERYNTFILWQWHNIDSFSFDFLDRGVRD